MNEPGEPNMGNPSVRFDEGWERVGHWPCASQSDLSCLLYHSYRYAWAERAKTCGYPERFAQLALGHNSKAVHRAYAKAAQVTLPPLEEYERKIVKLANGPSLTRSGSPLPEYMQDPKSRQPQTPAPARPNVRD